MVVLPGAESVSAALGMTIEKRHEAELMVPLTDTIPDRIGAFDHGPDALPWKRVDLGVQWLENRQTGCRSADIASCCAGWSTRWCVATSACSTIRFAHNRFQ